MRSQASRKSRLSTTQTNTIVEGVKQCWMALPRERQQWALRVTDAAVVSRAHQVQQTLYSSEMSCYNSGINLKFDQAGQPIVSTGLLHFQFEVAPKGPQAIVATQHLLDLPDFFGYMLARLGNLFPFGYPALRHKQLCSAFEPQPNSWTQFECQLLLLVEFAIYETFETERKAMRRRGAPGRCLRPPALEEVGQETIDPDLLTAEEEEAPSSRSSRRRARKRNDRQASSTSVPSASPKSAASNLKELVAVAEDATQAALTSSEDMGCIEDWTLVYRKARKAGTPQGSSACSTTSGHSRMSSWMTEATEVSKTSLSEISEAMDEAETSEAVDEVVCEEDLARCQQSLEATTMAKCAPVDSDRLARWVPVGQQGYVEEWLLADAQEEGVRACIKQTFWDVEHVRPNRPRTKSL